MVAEWDEEMLLGPVSTTDMVMVRPEDYAQMQRDAEAWRRVKEAADAQAAKYEQMSGPEWVRALGKSFAIMDCTEEAQFVLAIADAMDAEGKDADYVKERVRKDMVEIAEYINTGKLLWDTAGGKDAEKEAVDE